MIYDIACKSRRLPGKGQAAGRQSQLFSSSLLSIWQASLQARLRYEFRLRNRMLIEEQRWPTDIVAVQIMLFGVRKMGALLCDASSSQIEPSLQNA